MSINSHPNYRGTPWKPTPAQMRVLQRFKHGRQLPAHPDNWTRYDKLPLQTLVRRGVIKFLIGPYENHYLLTYAGQKFL